MRSPIEVATGQGARPQEARGGVEAIDPLLHYHALVAIQHHLTGDAARRDVLADLVAGTVNRLVRPAGPAGGAPLDARLTLKADALKRDGCAELGRVLSPQKVDDVVAHFEARPCYAGLIHGLTDGIGRSPLDAGQTFPIGCHRFEDVLAAPHLLEIANRPEMLALAEAYLGCTPTLYSLNAWWSFAGHGADTRAAQTFHRDGDDFRFCSLFIYLTDVDTETGPHTYIKGTHRLDRLDEILGAAGAEPGAAAQLFDLPDRGYGADDRYWSMLSGQMSTLVGPAGGSFMMDPFGLHKGAPVLRGRRLMFWARYGLYRNYAYHSDGLAPVPASLVEGRLPATDRARYVNRLIVAAS